MRELRFRKASVCEKKLVALGPHICRLLRHNVPESERPYFPRPSEKGDVLLFQRFRTREACTPTIFTPPTPVLTD